MPSVTRVAIIALVAAACRSEEAPTEPPAPAPADGLEVVSRGATPHQVLRYQLTKGISTQVQVEVDLDADTNARKRTMPTFITVMQVSAEEILPNGDAKVRTTIVRGSARERAGATDLPQVAAQAARMGGIELTGTLTPSGRMQAPALASGGKELSGDLRAQIDQTLARSTEIALPLPQVPVGVGAKWRHRKSLTIEGVEMEMVTDIELTAIDGPRVSYALHATAAGRPQTITLAGTKVEISNVRGGGAGKGVLDLSRMVVTGEQTLDFGFDLRAEAASDSMKLRVARRMRPPEPQGAQSAP